MRSIIWTILLCATAMGISFLAIRESVKTRTLRSDAAVLKTAIQPLHTVEVAHTTLLERQKRVAVESRLKEAQANQALQENQAEAERLQTEIKRLKSEIAASPKAKKPKTSSPHVQSQFTINEIIEAARLGNTHRLAELIVFKPEDEIEAQALFAQLPPEIQAENKSAQLLVASIAALTVFPSKTRSFKVPSAPELSEDNNSITWRLDRRESDSPGNPARIDCVLQRSRSDDWLLIVSPEMMASYRQAVTTAIGRK